MKELIRAAVLLCGLSLTTVCLQFEENPLDQSNGGLLGNLAIFAGDSTSGGTAAAGTVRFVALGDSGKGFTSIDGTTWTALDAAGNVNIAFKKVIWTGTSWVAVGNNTSTQFEIAYYSADGLTWTPGTISSPCTGPPRTLDDVVLGGTRLVAVGNSSGTGGCVQNSTDDGLTWSPGPAAAGSNPYKRVATDGSNFLVAITSNTAAAPTTYSSNGVATFAITTNFPNVGAGPGTSITGDLLGIGSTIMFVGLGAQATPASDSSFTASLGVAWTAATTPIFDGIANLAARGMATNGSRVVAVGDSCRVDDTDDTGLNWQFNGAVPGCTGVQFEDVVYDATTTTYYAAGNQTGPTAIWKSADNGLTWTEVVSGLSHTSTRSIASRP